MPITTVRRIELQKKLMTKLPQAERKWVFFLGHIANEITLLNKLLLWTQFHGDPKDLRVVAAAAQSIMVAKLLAGKQYEAAEILKASYFPATVRKIYGPLLNSAARQAEADLEAYFT